MRTKPVLIVAVAVCMLLPDALSAQTRSTGAVADTTTAVALSSAFRSAASRAMPAVVFIAVEQRTQRNQPQLREYFGNAPDPTGTGSGFIIDAQGHILTNNHVVADAARLTVRLNNGREYSARVVGSDVSTDLAVIKIEAQNGESFPTVTFGDSEGLRVGDWVLALGSPLGLDFTVTAGIVSAQGRQISLEDALEAYIQTDAAINPGNSGGPLIDLFGRVVGVNSAIFGSDRFVGYGFAVPGNLARRVLADLLEFGYLRRPYLGVRVGPVQAVEAELYNLPEVRGAFIAAVEPDQPAARAGVRAGDVILSLNGQPLRSDVDLITGLTSLRPGTRITLGVLRDGRMQDLGVQLGEFERTSPTRPQPVAQPQEPGEQVLGFSTRDVPDSERERLGVRQGVMVARVVNYGAAWNAGLREGAIILAFNGKRLQNAEQLRDLARDIRPGAAVSVTLYDRAFGEYILNYRTRQ